MSEFERLTGDQPPGREITHLKGAFPTLKAPADAGASVPFSRSN